MELVKGNLLYVHKKYLPSVLYNRLTRLAAFQNPEFYKAQAMRLSTHKKPRIIFCTEDFSNHLGLPRGCLDDVLEMLQSLGIYSKITDKRFAGNIVQTQFQGDLTFSQKQAAESLLKDDCGVLCATTAFGKTVVGAWLIARRQTNTLILVHRRQLMDQWYERLKNFLDLPSIGRMGGGKDQRTGLVDIAMLQSLNRKGEVQDKVADYGQIIVDECHHISAFRFEQVLRQVKAKYVCGLTATPSRKDGHHPIIYMQCGPIRFRVDAKSQAAVRPFKQIVIPRRTSFTYPHGNENVRIQDIYAALSADEKRNEMIYDDILRALDQGRSPLLLAERTTQVKYFEKRLQNFVRNIVVLQGGMGKKKRQAVAEKLTAIPDTEERLLIATGRYIGEGFDDARLDTLFLVSPLSWRGTLQQYAGRLHRLHSHKHKVIIYDYVDDQVPQLARMFSKRLAGYRAMGYTVKEAGKSKSDRGEDMPPPA
ncbi:MAG: DEAD/DEAH box helicase family protein [Desulfovermiculus sp.]|nr:DEAD/DEAH box helicase family protein [Desulfovermiculus sp.]